MQPGFTSGCKFLPNFSNYVHNIVAACLHCTSVIELCTAYVTIHHVSVLSHSHIRIFILPLIRHKAHGRPALQVLVTNGKDMFKANIPTS